MTNLETAVATKCITVDFPGKETEMFELGDRVATSKTHYLPQFTSEFPSATVTCECGKKYVVGDKAVTCMHANDAKKNQVVFERPTRKNKYELRSERQYSRITNGEANLTDGKKSAYKEHMR